ncbi:AAA family ATPase [Cryobacterium sp. TMT1-21]|uniref:AAA family ATPase n=1 Tax=Cryobacterium sp. TMT1-21 TaxID=1259234 RepID=UPI00141B3D5C|nr:AAA family ATPase [Cryobacterium sp. TMT1-21]
MTGANVRLEWLEVHGFRAFGSETRRLDLSSDLVVIHAGNSQGKTSLAEAVEFLLTGRSSRRDLFGGAKAEYQSSLRNAHLPADHPVWVAASFRDEGGVSRMVRRDLVSDFTGATECVSRLTVDGTEHASLALLGIEASEGAIAAPVLLQHTLRYVLSTEPKQRASYFKALLALSDLDLLRERVQAQAASLDGVPLGSGLTALERLSRTNFANVAVGLRELTGEKSEIHAEAGRLLVAESGRILKREFDSLNELVTALEQESQQRNDRAFPLTDFLSNPIESVPATPSLDKYADEIQRADELAASLLPVLTAVLGVPEFEHLDHPVDCPVCRTPKALTPDRIGDLRTLVRDNNHLLAAAGAATKALTDFRAQLRIWISSVRASVPKSGLWTVEREEEVSQASSDFGGAVPGLYIEARNQARSIASRAEDLVEIADRLDVVAETLLDLVARRRAIPDTIQISTDEIQRQTTILQEFVRGSEAAGKLRDVVEPVLRTRFSSEGTTELLALARALPGFVDEQYAIRQRAALALRLGRAAKIIKSAASAVLDARFAIMSGSITRWWASIRPEELVGFAGVKRRAAGAIFVNLVAALQADENTEVVERDALGVFSDSQLNALGLSTFLARAELVNSPFVFLDDPIPGSDGDHRLTFVQNTLGGLLDSGRQVIITTYDPKLAEYAHTMNESWDPITYDLALLNLVEGTEPIQTSDAFSRYMLQGEDGLSAPTAIGRRGACTAYRSAAERLAKQIVATNRSDAGTPTTVAEVERQAATLGELTPLVAPFTLSADEKGKWRVMPKILNPGNHDDDVPSTMDLKQIRGNLRKIHKAHKEKWGGRLAS